MSKRFIARKKFVRRKHKIKLFFYIFIVLLTCFLTLSILFKHKTSIKNNELVEIILHSSNPNINTKNSLLSKIISLKDTLNIKKPKQILESSFNYKTNSNDVLVFNDNYKEKINKEEHISYIEDPNPTTMDKPIVYIYNTHQLETYSLENKDVHNITPSVLLASYILKEKLNSLGVPSMVETTNIVDYMNKNKMKHYQSYDASRLFINNAIKNNNSLKYFIDIHRDGVGHDMSTVNIDGKNLAKVLFVVGLENKNYQGNLNLANQINNKIKEKYPTLTRGVITKKGKGVNGVYNQDISPNAILMECGGYENKIDEINNTLDIISKVLKEVINSK